MIETCPKKRMFLGITGLGVLTILVLIVESHLTDRVNTKKRDFPVEQNSTCKDKDTFEIIKQCEPCTAYDIASQSIGVCIHTHFKEVIKCSSGEMVTRSCDRAVYLDEQAYWKFEGFMFVSSVISTLCVIARKRVLSKPVPKVSLYTSDPSRYKPQNRIYTKQFDIENSLSIIQKSNIEIINSIIPFGHEVDFDWSAIPLDANPEGGALPRKRAGRKCEQLENLAKAVIKIACKEKFTIVDFCSGSGHLGILLAALLPNCEVILVENKEKSLERARERIKKLRLENVCITQCNLDYFKAKFDIGVSLHACGVATDLVIQNCINNKAHFVSCPCCYGGIHNCYHLKYPRSTEVSKLQISNKEYLNIAHAADQTHDEKNAKTEQGFLCMDIIDTDRKLMAESHGYTVHLGKLQPPSCTPKNNLLVGLSTPLCR
ncbi:putative methyltransferase [Trypoxylus dichotomus]